MAQKLGKYQIQEKLGEGATAEVYHAVDTSLGREVALKLLKPALVADPTTFERFCQEARAAAVLFHPNIATVFEIGEEGGRYFIAMRYVSGKSLDKILKEGGPLSWDETFRMARQIGAALDYAHGEGFLHRDVKPSNIMRDDKGDFWLTDFGLTRAMMNTGITTHTGALLGTPAYIAPEIWNGAVASPASDQYALACVLFEALTGETLFGGTTPQEIITKHLIKEPEFPENWPEGTPAGMRDVLTRALSREPLERFENIKVLASKFSDLETPAQERARLEAEEKVKVDSAEAARRDAEEATRREDEAQLQREAEEQARRDAERATKREVEVQARQEHETQEYARKQAWEHAAQQRAGEQVEETASESIYDPGKERIPLKTWKSVLLIAIGCAIGYAIGETIGWAIGGFITGWVLKNKIPELSWKSVLWITIGWAIGITFGYIIGWIGWGIGKRIGWEILAINLEISLLIVGVIVFAIVGAISGYITGWVLNREIPELSWKSVLWIAIGWAIGGAIFGTIGNPIGYSIDSTIDVAIPGAFGGIISGAISGAIGGSITLRELKRVQEQQGE
jgi:tRNA A-37 threonylcarbamoyl transferase component Bud32